MRDVCVPERMRILAREGCGSAVVEEKKKEDEGEGAKVEGEKVGE